MWRLSEISVNRAIRSGRNFTIIANSVARNESLSWGARGLLLYMLSHVNEWREPIRDGLENRSPDGRTKVENYARELEAAGYRRYVRYKNEKGQWVARTDWTDDPSMFDKEPMPGLPATGFPGVGEPGLIRRTKKKKDPASSGPCPGCDHLPDWCTCQERNEGDSQ